MEVLTTITGCDPRLTSHSSKYMTHFPICFLTNAFHSTLVPREGKKTEEGGGGGKRGERGGGGGKRGERRKQTERGVSLITISTHPSCSQGDAITHKHQHSLKINNFVDVYILPYVQMLHLPKNSGPTLWVWLRKVLAFNGVLRLFHSATMASDGFLMSKMADP